MTNKLTNNVGIIGHAGHGSTCISVALAKVLASQEPIKIVIDNNMEKERGITIDEPKPFIIENRYSRSLFIENNTRNHRRKEQRSTIKIKSKYIGNKNIFSK